jgi:hypothetical protein
MKDPLFGRLLLVVAIVAAVLFGTRTWLSGRHAGQGGDGPGLVRNPILEGEKDRAPMGDGPDMFKFAPPAGDWMQEIVVEGGEHVLIPMRISSRDDGSYRLEMPWRPPEPDVFGLPPWIQEHTRHIALTVDVDSTGHIIDVVGPDTYFDRLDETDPDTADALRALRIEEQVDEVLRWQITSVMSQPSVEGASWSALASFPGLASLPGWSGTLEYTVGPEEPCPAAAGTESCAPVSITGPGIVVRMMVGRDTGIEWAAALERTHGDATRRVTRRLLRPEDAPVPDVPSP